MEKTNVVKVIANQNGEVLSISPNNPEYGWLAVESVQPTFQENFLRLGRRVAFITGPVTQLEMYVEMYGISVGMELKGKIVVCESLTPINPKDSSIGIKYPNAACKEAGLACTVNDEPVYRKSFYTEDISMQDVLVKHDNGEAIKEFQAQQAAKAAKVVTPAVKSAAPKVAGKVK